MFKQKSFRRQAIVCFAVFLTASLTAAQADPVLTAEKGSDIPTEVEVANLLKKQPKSYDAHYAAGRLYEARGFYNEAQEEYKKAVSFPGNRPDGYKRLAQLALRSSEYPKAEKAATDGLQRFPKDYGMLLTAGFVLHNQNKLAPALNMYQRARAAKPNDAQICLAIADVLAAMHKPEQALLEIQRFEKLSKPNVLSIYEKAKVLLALKRVDEALTEMDKNFASDPANFANNKLYATTLAARGKKAKALEVSLCLLANGVGKEMESAKIRSTNLLTQLPSDAAPIIAAAENRLRDNKIKARLHFALGDVYDRKEMRELAIKQYQDGLKLNEKFARGHLRLGQDLERHRKDLKGALTAYQRASALDGDKKDREIANSLKDLQKKLAAKTK